MYVWRIIKLRLNINQLRNERRHYTVYRQVLNFLFRDNLLLTNCVTSGGCMFLGDLVQQEFEYRAQLIPKRYDWGRIGRMFTVGMALGPLHHYFYIYLDKLLPKFDARTITLKIFFDQVIAGPVFILVFFYGMGLLERKSLSECNEEVIDKFSYAFLGNFFFWVPVQLLNFYYLPTPYRVVYVNFATMVFNIFMSYMKHYDQH